MGFGYMILLFDGYGAGLVLINPRFYVEGVDLHGNPRNWFPRTEHEADDVLLARRAPIPAHVNFTILRQT